MVSLLLTSFCCNTKTLEAEKFLSSSQIFWKKSNFQCNWPVLGCTWSYQVQSNWHKYQVQSNLPSTKYFLPSYMYLVLGGQVQSTKYLAKSTWCLVNYKSNCKVIGNSSKVTVLDTALRVLQGRWDIHVFLEVSRTDTLVTSCYCKLFMLLLTLKWMYRYYEKFRPKI